MARRKPAQVHGVVIVDKPAGCTSHDVVDRLRRRFGERKIGHAGTLDPDATGVLVLGVGDATRLMRFMDLVVVDGVSSSRKSYTGDVVLGTETTTLDAAGDITVVHDMTDVRERLARPDGREFVQQIVNANLVGDIMQVPPMVSAIRVDGQRLHELAREGIEIEREARPVTVYRCDVTGVGSGVISLDVSCSSGTFIRSIAADLGRLLGGGAHLTNLRRTTVGAFTLADAGTIDDAPLLPVAEGARGLTSCDFSGEAAVEMAEGLVTGRVVRAARLLCFGPPPWAVILERDHSRSLGAVFEPFENAKVGSGMARPAVNLLVGAERQ
ncbi:MAG: tRNA pseudouridine synthase [Actinomycetota bacterium]